MNQENNNSHDNRYINYEKKKIKRIMIGIVLAIIAGTIIVASDAVLEISANEYNMADLKNYLDYRDGIISYTEYNDRRYELLHDLYQTQYEISIVSNSARIGLNIIFIFIIIGFLSIAIDKSFNNKMRRISLILACITSLSITYFIFLSVNVLFIGF